MSKNAKNSYEVMKRYPWADAWGVDPIEIAGGSSVATFIEGLQYVQCGVCGKKVYLLGMDHEEPKCLGVLIGRDGEYSIRTV
jgi:hypothetical protein